jgi:hypothetical protein
MRAKGLSALAIGLAVAASAIKIAELREEARQQKNCGHERYRFFAFSKLG